MEKVFDFLSKHKDVAFATVEQNKPKIRVFQIMKQEGHTLYPDFVNAYPKICLRTEVRSADDVSLSLSC